jgi:hypothetical protein
VVGGETLDLRPWDLKRTSQILNDRTARVEAYCSVLESMREDRLSIAERLQGSDIYDAVNSELEHHLVILRSIRGTLESLRGRIDDLSSTVSFCHRNCVSLRILTSAPI